MVDAFRDVFAKAKAIFLDDLRQDPYLRYILLLAFLMAGFWLWYRVPNFATPDEYGRLLRPMKAAGYFLADRSVSAFIRGATDGVAQGATFYLYGVVLIPVFIVVVVSGQLGEFAALAGIDSRWTLWHEVPAWFWTSSVVLARFVNVLFAIGAVYVTYRIGTEIRNRQSGRLAAALLSLSLGFIASAHEANEDTAAVLLLLSTLYVSIRYLRTGEVRMFYTGCVIGGLAIAFKLTAGIVVFFLGLAGLVRFLEAPPEERSRWAFGKLLLLGGAVGLVVIYVGRPNILFIGPQSLINRMFVSLSSKSQPLYVDSPPGGLLLYSYLNGVGLPLFLAMVLGVIGGLYRVWRDRNAADAEVLILAGLVVYIGVVGQWSTVKTHHVLPTVPLVILLFASFGPSIRRRFATGGEIMIAVLLISTGLYATAGVVQYASDPRDQATAWLSGETTSEETVLVYENSVADVGVVHGRPVTHYDFVEKVGVSNQVKDEEAYTRWMVTSPDREPDVIQVTDEELRYLDPAHGREKTYPKRAAFMQQLVSGDHFGYTVVRRYGTLDMDSSFYHRILLAGIRPEVEKLDESVIILRNS